MDTLPNGRLCLQPGYGEPSQWVGLRQCFVQRFVTSQIFLSAKKSTAILWRR
jgi:hypothetical protein